MYEWSGRVKDTLILPIPGLDAERIAAVAGLASTRARKWGDG